MQSRDNGLLRLAVPNKGSLAQAASDMLREAGYKQRGDPKQLSLTDRDNGVEFFYLRPRDIALYVGEGTLDLGITGRDLLLDEANGVEFFYLRPRDIAVYVGEGTLDVGILSLIHI